MRNKTSSMAGKTLAAGSSRLKETFTGLIPQRMQPSYRETLVSL
jgi:hypothetical protein